MYQVCHQMHTNARDLLATINHAEVAGNTAVVLGSLSDIAQASMNCHPAYQLKKGGE